MITEIKSKIESSEEEAKSSEEEAITYISEGIEATYVVNKQQVYEKKVETQKKSEQEYGSKKVKYEEETTKWTKKLNEKKTLKVTATSELKDINSRIDILTTRLEKVKDEEKKSVEKEISSLKSEVTRYEKIIEGYTTEITTITSTIKTIYTTWTTYYTYYIRVRAETSNSLQVSRQTERTSINRIRRRNHRHSHKHRVIQIK
jgi:chromosome segregation ATPase